jgi:glutamate synthase (NADPH/NADH) small chain
MITNIKKPDMTPQKTAMPAQDPSARIDNYNEIKTGYTEELAVKEALRCMNCPGRYCAVNCPIHNPIPEINEKIRENDFEGAWELLNSNSPLPEVCSRVCDQSKQCESECSRGIKHEPVSIGGLERFLADRYAGKNTNIKIEPATGKKVAIIGAGPAGISAAWDLMRKGHDVTVYEKQEEPGGLMMYGIPNMKLDKELLTKRFNLMKELGVKFECNTEISKDIPAEKLLSSYDAVLVAIGTAEARRLQVPGSSASGIVPAVEYLKAGTKNALEEDYVINPVLNAAGKNVIIIGAGDTGTDCAATAIRQGAASIHQFEITAKPDADPKAQKLPWKDWPKVFRTEYGQEEVITKFHEDPRIYSIATKEIIADENGNVEGLRTLTADGQDKTWEADLVITAMGFTGPDNAVLKELGVSTNERGNVKANNEDYKTNIDKVFACGDARRGQSMVIWGVSEGKQAADAIDSFFKS